MNYGLDIKPEGKLDFLSLGALVHRLDPGIIPFRKANHCDIHVSGGEFNCAANLSRLFSHENRLGFGDGGLPHRRYDSRARARYGRDAVL